MKGIPYLNTYDGHTIRYPDPLIKANDTIKLDIESNKVTDFIKFDVGNVVMVTGGRNRGCVGVIKNMEKHKGTFEIIHIQDSDWSGVCDPSGECIHHWKGDEAVGRASSSPSSRRQGNAGLRSLPLPPK
ncbi:40S ribosomal protein S4 [Acorus calamus]|uniref:40S ribosomal protein S4 n=1 Tax=Acorus calamus TaxID=4465 RepID=A0AAV9DKQ1_ACOCL|nr:40S ribosomal protein S4 [Acorus calamus]